MTALRRSGTFPRGSRWARLVGVVVIAASVAGACSSGAPSTDATAPSTTTTSPVEDQPETVDFFLPERSGARPATSETVPHVQLDARPVDEVDAELRRRAFLLPGVRSEPSTLSLPGAVQLALDASVTVAGPDVIEFGGEFAHIHPDGSLHIWLPVDIAQRVDDANWGELHPWVGRDGFWDGTVLLFTPETLEELDVVLALITESYNFVVGADVDPAELK